MDGQWLAAEFRQVVAELLGPLDRVRMQGFRIVEVEAGGNARIVFEGVPEAPEPEPHFARPDHPLIVQAAAWTLERRARRFAAKETFGKGDEDYYEELRRRHPGRFECEVSPGPGWADLIFEMAARVEALDPGPDFAFTQVKEKFGTLRAYNTERGEASRLVDAFEAVSCAICETCGSPGSLGRHSTRNGWWRTRCADHVHD